MDQFSKHKPENTALILNRAINSLISFGYNLPVATDNGRVINSKMAFENMILTICREIWN